MNTVRRLSFAMLATLVAVSLTDRSEASPVTTQLYFTDQGTGTIDTYNVGTSTLSTFAADANYAAGISPDPTGGFYVANLATGQLEQYNPSGGTPVGPSLGFGIFGTAVSPLNGDIVVGNYFTTNTLAQVTPGGSVSAFTTNVIKNAQGRKLGGVTTRLSPWRSTQAATFTWPMATPTSSPKSRARAARERCSTKGRC